MKKNLLLLTVLLWGAVGANVNAQLQNDGSRSCPRVNILKTSDTICGIDNGGSYPIAVSIRGANLLTEWSSDGSGFFAVDSNNVFYLYDRSDAGRGSVWLYVTVRDTVNRCPVAKDSLFLKLNDPARISFANTEQPVCGNSPVNIEANISGTATAVSWRTSGTGYFADNSFNVVTYYPSIQDRKNNGVTITATTNDPEGPCPATSAFTLLVFTDGIVDAGPDLKICASSTGGVIELNPVVYGNLYNGSWATNGSGTFDDAASFYTNYNYTAADVARGNIELYVTGELYDCGTYTDTIKIWLQQQPVLTMPREFVSACGKRPIVIAEVQLSGSISGGTWTSSGTGAFSNPASLITTYRASRADLANRCVRLIFTTDSSDPCGCVSKGMRACFSAECSARRIGNDILPPDGSGLISVYPNPATTILNINQADFTDKKFYRITDITGKSISCRWVSSTSLDIAALKPGTYLLVAMTGSGKQTVKFVKR